MQGQLFTQDFLTRGILETPPHQALTEADFTAFRHSLQSIFAAFDSHSTIKDERAFGRYRTKDKVLLRLADLGA